MDRMGSEERRREIAKWNQDSPVKTDKIAENPPKISEGVPL